jgi:uncharacterized membrane protein
MLACHLANAVDEMLIQGTLASSLGVGVNEVAGSTLEPKECLANT